MKKMTVLAAFMGLALVFGSAASSEAGCFIGCGGDNESDNSRSFSDNIGGDQVDGDKFNKLAETITDSVVTTNQTVEGGHAHMGNVGDVAGSVSNSASATVAGIDKSHDNNVQILNGSTLNQ